MHRNLKFFGYASAILMALGIFFKIQHWPGASILLITSAFIFCLVFLPLLLFHNLKKGEDKLFSIVQAVSLFLLGIAFIFRVQLWAGGPFVSILANTVFIFCLLPVYLIRLKKKIDQISFNINLVFILIGISLFLYLQSNSRFSGLISTFGIIETQLENSLLKHQSNSALIYEGFNHLETESKIEWQTKAKLLQIKTDSLINQITHIRNFLISETEEIPYEEASNMSNNELKRKMVFDRSTFLLIGDDASRPRKDENSGYWLKQKINQYHQDLSELLDQKNRKLITGSLVSLTEDQVTPWGERMPWESYNFFHVPLSFVLTALLNTQVEIKAFENQLVHHFYNEASKNEQEKLAMKVAELADRIESEKKQREIELLKKDQELFDAKMAAKESEISALGKIIGFAVLGLLVIIVFAIILYNSNVERKKANKLLSLQKQEIEHKNILLEHQKKEITDSINYAKRIQNSLLPAESTIKNKLPESFILYRPKDIVSGDFYWAHENENSILLAAVDCTGHGVPGAFMSSIGASKLNEAADKTSDVSEILSFLNKGVKRTLRQNDNNASRDGMDLALIKIDLENNFIEFAGANRPLWIFKNSGLVEVKPSKTAIGGFTNDDFHFEKHHFKLEKGDILYLFSDGYPDQFGGPKAKKFMAKQFKSLLESILHLPMEVQKEKINMAFDTWKGELEQVDDVCVIGVRV
jgi:serine phosphatase RsbU (regulator of sigma subunit)